MATSTVDVSESLISNNNNDDTHPEESDNSGASGPVEYSIAVASRRNVASSPPPLPPPPLPPIIRRDDRPPAPLPASSAELHPSPTVVVTHGALPRQARSMPANHRAYQSLQQNTESDGHRRVYGATRQTESPQSETSYVEPVQSQNMIFGRNVKRYILSSLGILKFPGTSISCTWISLPFYALLALWGTGILAITCVIVTTQLNNSECEDIIPIFSLTIAGGFVFLLLGFYWMLVFWWRHNCDNFRKSTFSVLMIVWFILALFFIGLLAALATEVYENRDVIISNKRDNKSCDPEDSSGQFLPNNYNIIPLMMLGSMTLVWLVHVCVFFVTCCVHNKITVA